MTARILNCSPGDYYRDPCAVPSLSQSIAHTLVTQSPLHAWSEHPRLGNQRKPASKAMDVGSLIHKLVLGKGVDVEIVLSLIHISETPNVAKGGLPPLRYLPRSERAIA